MAEPVLHLSVTEDLHDKRLDSYLAELEEFVHLSRSRIQDMINSGHILVNDKPRKKGYLVRRSDRIAISFPPPEDIIPKAEDVPLDIIYEDEDIIVLAKAAGLVVHPAGGHEKGTLVNGLLYHSPSFKCIGGDPLRPGIVHRLDKDTSGVMVVAKNDSSRQELTRQFKNRKVKKLYHAVLSGVPEKEGTVRKNLGRHPVHRKKRAVSVEGGKEAVTHWQVLEVFGRSSFVRLQLDTGRTHQIRVHLAFLHCPVAGDPLYGGKERQLNLKPPRLCLHASSLAFNHPGRGHKISFTAPLPADLREFLEVLRHTGS